MDGRQFDDLLRTLPETRRAAIASLLAALGGPGRPRQPPPGRCQEKAQEEEGLSWLPGLHLMRQGQVPGRA